MIHCTNADLDKLRDQQGTLGPVSKLRLAEPPEVTVVDQLAIMRFLRPIVDEIRAYEEFLLKLLKQHGVLRSTTNGQTVYDIPPDKSVAYDAEKKRLDEISCELSVVPLHHKYFAGKVRLSVRDLEALTIFVVLPEAPTD
jgi:hypothetical protein